MKWLATEAILLFTVLSSLSAIFAMEKGQKYGEQLLTKIRRAIIDHTVFNVQVLFIVLEVEDGVEDFVF